MPTPITHYCQKCLAANPLGQDFCARCGTRLMIVVDPPGARFDVGEANISTDEHLLERISALENKSSRLTERLERGLDLLLRQAQNSYFDRSLVKALIGLLTDDGIVQSERLERLWGERCQDDAVEQEESVHRDELRLRILAGFSGSNRNTFEDLINEGFLLIEDKQIDRGFGALQQASELSRKNSSLDLFIGEHFFRNGKIKLAHEHLSRAHHASPEDLHISLLLGLTCADNGEVELAKQLLNQANERGGSSFAAHYGLGRLFVAEKNWPHALREFKRALSIKPSPEAHYVLACLYYQLHRDGLATRHLLKAIEMDGTYREALHLLALIYRRKGGGKLAEEAVQKAKTGIFAPTPLAKRRRISGSNQERPGLNKNKPADAPSIAPLFQVPPSRSRRLMTGADKRLAEALREDALKAFTLPQNEASSR